MHPSQIVADRFEIDRLAGSGGMGSVYRARDRVEGGVVALKVLHGQGVEHVDRFVREARVLADLRHPGIVRYVAHGRTQAGELYLAMEWLDGEDLAKRLAREGLTVDEAVRVVSQACEALSAAHTKNVVHRDIKPSNLYLVADDLDRVKLLDFGVARMVAEDLARTRTGMMLGTPGYMAPEQARGARDIDSRADVFALGCVLFECLAGRPPFVGEHAMAVLAKIILDEAPRVRELKQDVPEPLDDLVARMLAKEPEERPADAAAVLAELRALGSIQGSSPAPSAGERPAALTVGEQRLICAVMAGATAESMQTDAMAVTLTPDVAQAGREPLRQLAAPFGARLEWLANGSIVATLAGHGTATDQAVRAARFALALRPLLPDAPMSLATGRGIVGGDPMGFGRGGEEQLAVRWPIGEVIDRAARLLHDAAGEPRPRRTISIDDVTAGLLDARFEVISVATRLELRGEREPLDAGRSLLGKPTPFVGRERELTTLEATFAECVSDSVARAVVVTGGPGVGKTRLRQELVLRLRAREEELEIWAGRGDPMSAGSPFGLLAQIVRDAAGIAAGEPLGARQARLRARVARHVPAGDQARVAEFLGELSGTPFSDDASVQLRAARADAMLMGDQMRRAWEDWLGAESTAHATAIVLEDLHHGDLPSVKFVDAALRHLAERPLFVLALARPEVEDLFPRLWSERGAQELRLGELSRKACERLAKQVLGASVVPQTLAGVVERAAGNAYFLEELIRAVAEGRGDELPPTVVAMVQARLESLPAEARRVLRAASVFGMVFPRGGTLELLGFGAAGQTAAPGGARTRPDEWIADLVSREVITRVAAGKFPGEEEYAFRHAPQREASYAMLTDSDRVLGHRLAGLWLERAGESDPMTLAGHFERGNEPGRAVKWTLRGAEQALEGNDFAAAIARAAQGVRSAGHVTRESLPLDADIGALHLIAAEAHRWRGESAEAEGAALEAMRRLPRGSAPWCSAAGEAALAAGRLGHVDGLVGMLSSLPAMAFESTPGLAVAWGRVAGQLLYAGRRDLVGPVFHHLAEVVDSVERRDPAAGSRVQAARSNLALFDGDTLGYLLLSQAAAEDAVRAGDVRGTCLLGVSIGFAYLELGAFGHAKNVLRGTLVDAQRMGLSNVERLAKHNLGLALARDGAIDAGRAAESEAIQACVAAGDRRLEGMSRHYLATILVAADELPGAEREARQAIALLEKNPPLRAHALATLGRILLRAGRAADAMAAAGEASRQMEALGGIQEGEALVRLVHAEALFASGDLPGARAAIATAAARLAERAAKIPDPAWRQSFLGNVPEHDETLRRAQEWAA